jgi:hypothetical protein
MGLSKLIRELFYAGAGLLAALLLLEAPALVGLVDYRNVTWLSGDRFDPELLKIHRPHLQLRGSARGGLFAANFQIPQSDMSLYRWDLRYDNHGFRNRSDLNRADIAVLGASFVEAVTTPAAQMTTTLLADETGSVVANLGQNDYSPQQDLVVLERYGLPLQPRTVVWMVTDFYDLRQTLYYRVATRRPAGFWPEFRLRSFSAFAVRELRPYLHPASKPDGGNRSGVVVDASGRPVRLYFLHPGAPLNPESLSALAQIGTILASAYRLIASQGGRLLVVYIPEAYRVFQPYARFAPGSPCLAWVVNDEPQRIEAAVHSISSGIGYLDLTPAMRQAASRGVIPYFTDDNHWSPAGHRIAAHAIAEYLGRTGSDSSGLRP